MKWYKDSLELVTNGKGMYAFTQRVEDHIRLWGIHEGICFLYLPHTSASLVINENYDPTAQQDIEAFMDRLVPGGQTWQRHTLEGPDDSASHLRSVLTPVSLSIPIDSGRLSLGTWQGIYLFEHREEGQRRTVLLRCLQVE